MPAKAGIQLGQGAVDGKLDSRLRGNDNYFWKLMIVSFN